MTMAVNENVRFRPRHFEGAKEAEGKPPEVRVLDGQQRLTSLYLSLFSKGPVKTKTEKKGEDHPDRLDEIFTSHLIDPKKIRTDDFSGFIEHRAGELLTIIEQAMGKTISGRNSEESLREIPRLNERRIL